MSTPPTGTVTFLFTDIEGSTRLWEQRTAEMKVGLARHDEILRGAIESNGGHVFKTVGDAFCAAFATAMEGLRAALDAQRALAAEPWEVPGGIRVRMGLHTGTAEERDNDYFGPTLNRTARLFSTGAGGQVLVSLVTAELLRDSLPEDVGLRDLGAHRLKDLMRPESIFQVVAPGLRSDFPQLKSLDNHPNNLPLQPTPFIGREKELEAASRSVLGDTCRVLTLTGVGGAGKTRLALQAAANLTDRFPEGVYFVDLSAIDSPSFVLPAIARTLGLQLSGGRSAIEVLRDALKERSVLLVLDNFEQVMPAVANVVELLSACPCLKAIVTSREALHIRSENVVPLPTLSAPKVRAAREMRPDHLGQYESVALFIDRARATRPDFVVTNDNAPAVAEICARLDGLPLAIELAAARVAALPPQAILQRLGNRLKLLTGGAADLPFRQRTLRATIDWSYRMLSPDEQMLFCELSAFAGGATLDAIETVCGCGNETNILEVLSSLASKSLVLRADSSENEPRFQMLETMREYATEILSAEAVRELRGRHASYFLSKSERLAAGQHGPRQRETYDRFEAEFDNFQAALDWLHTRGPLEEELKLVVSLTPLWRVRGFVVEGWHSLERALPTLPHAPPAAQGRVFLALARMAESQDRYQEALGFLESARSALTLAGDVPELLAEEYERGWCCYRLNRQEEAIAHYRTVLVQAGADEHLRALAELGIGSSLCMQGKLDEAQVLLERSREVFSRGGDDQSLTRTILSTLMISYQKEDFRTAIGLCREALDIEERLKDHFSQIIGYNNLGSLHLNLQQHEQAREAYEKLLNLAERAANRTFACWAHAGLAESYLGLADVNSARRSAEHAVSIAASLDDAFARGVTARVMAEVDLRLGRYDRAVQEFSRCIPLIEESGDLVERRRAANGLEKARTLMASSLSSSRGVPPD